jgi:hypothetical protein
MEQALVRLPGPPQLPRSNHGIDAAKLSGNRIHIEWLTSSHAPRSFSKPIQLNAVTVRFYLSDKHVDQELTSSGEHQ